MKLIGSQRQIAFFLGGTFLLALSILLTPGSQNDWILDPLTGIVAAVASLVVCTRLALGAPNKGVRQLLQVVLVLLVLVGIGQFAEPFSDHIERYLGIEDVGDCLMLAVAPVLLWLTARIEPVPVAARRVMWCAFAVQILAAVLDLRDSGFIIPPGGTAWPVLPDFFDLVSMQFYLVAAAFFVSALHKQMLPDAWFSPAWKIPRLYSEGRSLRDRLYPPPFISGRHLPPPHTPAGRVHRLCNEALWRQGDVLWSVRNLALIALWPAVASVRALKAIKVHGTAKRELTGKSLTHQFVEQVSLAVTHRITPTYYYGYEFYRSEQWRQAANYLMRYETKEIAYRLLYPVESETYRPTPLKNKIEFARYCAANSLSHVPVLGVFDKGKHLPVTSIAVSMKRLPSIDLFIKPAFGKGGSGAERWHKIGERIYRNTHGVQVDEESLLRHIEELSSAEPFFIQPAVSNCRELSDLGAGALCTARVVSIRNEAGDFEVTHAAFRMSVNPASPVDNFHAGGVAAAVDIETGRLGSATDIGHSSKSKWHDRHPYSGVQIVGRTLPMWRDVVDLAMRAHRVFNDYAVVGWDIAFLDDGPCLVEGNRGPDVDIIQRTGRAPIGNSRFGELLAHNLERKRSEQDDIKS